MVIKIKRWLSNRVLAVKAYAVLQSRPIGCVYKTETKYVSKDEIELAVFESFWEVLLMVRVFWLRLAVLISELLGVLLLGHSVGYGDDGTHDKQRQASTNIK